MSGERSSGEAMLEFKVYLDNKLIQKTVVSKGRITIGRSSENDIVLQNKHISRLHVVIEQEGNQFHLQDMSSNGLLMDNQRVSGVIPLPPQCRLSIHPFEIDCSQREDDTTLPILE